MAEKMERWYGVKIKILSLDISRAKQKTLNV